jgi:hypothetical protein
MTKKPDHSRDAVNTSHHIHFAEYLSRCAELLQLVPSHEQVQNMNSIEKMFWHNCSEIHVQVYAEFPG